MTTAFNPPRWLRSTKPAPNPPSRRRRGFEGLSEGFPISQLWCSIVGCCWLHRPPFSALVLTVRWRCCCGSLVLLGFVAGSLLSSGAVCCSIRRGLAALFAAAIFDVNLYVSSCSLRIPCIGAGNDHRFVKVINRRWLGFSDSGEEKRRRTRVKVKARRRGGRECGVKVTATRLITALIGTLAQRERINSFSLPLPLPPVLPC
ncbi:hypothetical protein RIF29_38074 [Crotalaria pallida]|uniref:Uncharacterized protein n=1 Tax=Crotalaria pallida TaxID=3830 RepID=A0AAN9E0G5_CROPI